MKDRINLSGNSVSRVWREGEWIYKQQPKYLADNEWYALRTMADYDDFVPSPVKRIDEETIRMPFVENEPVTNVELFMSHYKHLLYTLGVAKLRHGDLSEYSVLVRDNRPVIIDWAESRTWDDPRPDKRRAGDAYWLRKTMMKLCESDGHDV